jgi:hypothetical protein
MEDEESIQNKEKEQFIKWASDYLHRNGIDSSSINLDSEYDPNLNNADNMRYFASKYKQDAELEKIQPVNESKEEKVLREREIKAVKSIDERSRRLEVAQLEREERKLANKEFENSTAGFMLAKLAGRSTEATREFEQSPAGMVSSVISKHTQKRQYGGGSRNYTRDRYERSNSLLSQAALSGRPNYELGQSKSNYGGSNSLLAQSLIGQRQTNRGRYVTVVERGIPRRVRIEGGEYSSQPVAQSLLGMAMIGGTSNGRRATDHKSLIGVALSGDNNKPTLLQAASNNNLFTGAKSKSHNNLFTAAINNKSKLKWR